jgi:hypothetical protein
MPKLIKTDSSTYTLAQTWYCESVSDVNNIPETAPVGSIVEILTNEGLKVKMKNSSGNWIDI